MKNYYNVRDWLGRFWTSRKNKKIIKRYKLIPKVCSRCGNDLMTGSATFHLPYEKRYMVLCSICARGLRMEEYLTPKNPTMEDWKDFWNKEVKV